MNGRVLFLVTTIWAFVLLRYLAHPFEYAIVCVWVVVGICGWSDLEL